jgi:hypothetical protein
MVDINKLKPAWHDYRTDIPSWILKGIGQVAAEWAVLERELEELIRLLMDIRIEFGRIVVNWMSASTRAATAQHLIQLRILDDKLERRHLETFTKLAKKIGILQTKRDILAHGLWAKFDDNWCTLMMRQSRTTPELEPDLSKLSRAVLPQRYFVTRDILQKNAQEIAKTADAIVAFSSILQKELAPLTINPPKYKRRRRKYD